MIDCDLHQAIGDLDDFLTFVEPEQRDWFEARGPQLGLPAYRWLHPTTWFKEGTEPRGGGPPGSGLALVREQVLDGHALDMAVLVTDHEMDVSLMPDPGRAVTLARAYNDWVAARWLDEDDRLRGSIICPAQDPLAAAAEVRRVAEDRRFVQVLLCAGADAPYGHPRYLPVLEAAAESRLPVAIHSGGEGMGTAAPPSGAGDPSYYLEYRSISPSASASAHLASLIAHGTFDRLPGLRVLFVEVGLGWIAPFLWRLDEVWAGARPELPAPSRAPSEIVRRHVRFTTQPLGRANVPLLIEMLASVGGPEILCYGSDYPHWDAEEPDLVSRELPEEWKQRVLNGTAAELYGERMTS